MNPWQERIKLERRFRKDSRSKDCEEYFSSGGKEGRKKKERRTSAERRDGWMRVGKWRSVSVFDD